VHSRSSHCSPPPPFHLFPTVRSSTSVRSQISVNTVIQCHESKATPGGRVRSSRTLFWTVWACSAFSLPSQLLDFLTSFHRSAQTHPPPNRHRTVPPSTHTHTNHTHARAVDMRRHLPSSSTSTRALRSSPIPSDPRTARIARTDPLPGFRPAVPRRRPSLPP